MDDWKTTDFKPAPAGWTALYLYDDVTDGPDFGTYPVAGWLVQRTNRAPVKERIVAAIVPSVACGEPEAVTDVANFWMLLGPGQRGPNHAAIKDEREARATAAARANETPVEPDGLVYTASSTRRGSR